MLKIIKLTYGTHGKSKEYSYIVDKDIRVGQVVQPSVKHVSSGKIFGTTGVVQHVYKPTSTQGVQARTDLDGKEIPLANVVTAKQAGIMPNRGIGGKYEKTGIHKTQKNAYGVYAVPEDIEFENTNYIDRVRQANVTDRENNGYETFAQYSARFENKEQENNGEQE